MRHQKTHKKGVGKKQYPAHRKSEFESRKKLRVKNEPPEDEFKGKGKYPCNKCVFVTTSYAKLRSHKESNHKNEFPCELCNFVGDSVSSLEEHKINSNKEHQVAAIEHVKFPCDKCEFVSLKEYLLNIHIRDKHSDKVLFCDQCDYKSTNIQNLYQHIGRGVYF